MKKVMIVNTSADHYEGFDKPTGLWLGELVHFYDVLKDEAAIDIFNIKGGDTPIDPVSLSPVMLDKTTKSYMENKDFMNLLKNSPSIEKANPSEYDAIYFTGGHGVMFDFPENKKIQESINTIYNNGGVVSAVCHGIAALTEVKNEKGRFFIDGKKLTGFSNIEEKLANRTKYVPFLLEDQLKLKGADYSKTIIPFTVHVIVDGRLVTGQNPQSPKDVGKEVLELLNHSQ